jgi:hypothetical protein
MHYWTQEAVKAETDYRLERAQAAALRREARKAHPSRLRRLFTRSAPTRRPVRRVTPALP